MSEFSIQYSQKEEKQLLWPQATGFQIMFLHNGPIIAVVCTDEVVQLELRTYDIFFGDATDYDVTLLRDKRELGGVVQPLFFKFVHINIMKYEAPFVKTIISKSLCRCVQNVRLVQLGHLIAVTVLLPITEAAQVGLFCKPQQISAFVGGHAVLHQIAGLFLGGG